ncbi:hypothetical protein Taro_008822 [Colocasia esculenta]|uniref:Uncharacterized protein n=1 Tax=Colocasia esculenta TaxID=4460 RepID=A0A843U446_COLES|nr:hypothetical protein [Colocasia esculenta]
MKKRRKKKMDPAFPGTTSAMLHRTMSGRRRLAPRTPEWEELSTSFLHLVDDAASSHLNSGIQSGDTVALPFPDSVEVSIHLLHRDAGCDAVPRRGPPAAHGGLPAALYRRNKSTIWPSPNMAGKGQTTVSPF